MAEEFGLRPDNTGVYREIAYIGDDLNDISCMKVCEVVGCPCDAADDVKKRADFISEKRGGDGAVRGFITWLTA